MKCCCETCNHSQLRPSLWLRPSSPSVASVKAVQPAASVGIIVLLRCRCAGHPFVVNPPHVKFYCGAPLVTSTDTVMGTL